VTEQNLPDQAAPVCVPEWEPLAEARADAAAWAYVAGGSGDEHTLRWNVERWADLRLAPHALTDVSAVDTSLSLLGTDLAHPILLAPTASQRLVHPDGEREVARGAAAAEALFVHSTLATTTVEEVAAAAKGPWWLQLYVQADRGFTRALVDRAAAAGARAVVLTVDTPVLGARDRDRRNNVWLPAGLAYENLRDLAVTDPYADLPAHRRIYNPRLDATLSWRDLDWLCSVTDLPVLTKGILRPDDAARAVAAGVAAVIVSNHGARNLDTVPATVDALPPVVDAVAGAVPVLVDGGIRRGTDVAKALCLGAQAVLIGRPYLWGLAVAGADGVRTIVETLRTELHIAMALLGAPSLSALSPDLIWPADRPSGRR
jgi:4-hydroxymandelate oxidase